MSQPIVFHDHLLWFGRCAFANAQQGHPGPTIRGILWGETLLFLRFTDTGYNCRRKDTAMRSQSFPTAERFLNSERVIRREFALSALNVVTCSAANSAS